jgi:hypothetical protein
VGGCQYGVFPILLLAAEVEDAEGCARVLAYAIELHGRKSRLWQLLNIDIIILSITRSQYVPSDDAYLTIRCLLLR